MDFEDFCEAAEIIKTGAHNSQEGCNKVIALKNRMNKGRLFISSFEARGENMVNKLCEESGPFYIYNRNRSILYYQTTNFKELTVVLKIKRHYLLRCLDNGTVYYEKFTFSRSLIPTAEHHILPLSKLNSIMSNIRSKRKKKR